MEEPSPKFKSHSLTDIICERPSWISDSLAQSGCDKTGAMATFASISRSPRDMKVSDAGYFARQPYIPLNGGLQSVIDLPVADENVEICRVTEMDGRTK